MKKIIILGGSGFVGKALTLKLLEKNYKVLVLDISPTPISHENLEFKKINLMSEKIDNSLVENSYAVINLAGVPIFGRFTKKYKKLIYDSRIETTKNIVKTISETIEKPKFLVSASAIGYYGNRKEELLNEENTAGEDFLAKVCIDWENEALKIQNKDTKVVILRTAHVIGQGGLAKVLKNLFQKQIGGYFGNGLQRMPFISLEDLVDLYIFSIEKDLNGIYNTAASNPTQKEFMKTFKERYGGFILWRIPRIFGYILYGEFIDALIGGQNIDNTKIKKEGFVYKYTDLKELLTKLD